MKTLLKIRFRFFELVVDSKENFFLNLNIMLKIDRYIY